MNTIKNIIREYAWIYVLIKHIFLRAKYLRHIGGLKIHKIREKPVLEIKIDGSHCFFGYYDKSPWNSSMNHILYNAVRKDKPEFMSVNVYDLNKKLHRTLGETNAWNWQQGTMLQWLSDDEVMYNVYDSEKKVYKAKSQNITTGSSFFYTLPIYSKGKISNKFLSLNFSRLHLYAKGYGYNACKEINLLPNEQDGIWEVNMENNDVKMLLSIEDVVNFKSKSEFTGANHYINHVEYCADDNRCIFIHRWSHNNEPFKSRLILFNINTKELQLLLDNAHVSHYCWKNESELFIYATKNNHGKGYFLIDINTHCQSDIYSGMPEEDGHPSYSPDKRFILTDTYPNASRIQSLFLYENFTGKLKSINELYSPFKYFDDFRCDLHPRWSPDGEYISVDTTYSGSRSICIFKAMSK